MMDFDDLGGMTPRRDAFAGQSFGIYPRVSSAQQGTDDKVSLDAQIAACREYGEDLGMVLDEACVRKEVFTSTTLERPELKALLRDMIARKVRNLVIDRADRLTREGQLAATKLLIQFTDAGITLHIAAYGMTVHDEFSVSQFLQMAFAAKLANTNRVHALMRARRQYAKDGRYLQGNRPPYGFVFRALATDAKGRPTRTELVKDERIVNGHNPWEVRRRICHDYLAGKSLMKIAEQLTADRVPTSGQLAHAKRATGQWNPSTVRGILRASINEGVAISFATRLEWQYPDDKHDTRWLKRVEASPERQVLLPDSVVSPDAIILTHEEAEAIRTRLSTGKQLSWRNSGSLVPLAMLRGAMARCGLPRPDNPDEICNGGLRVHTDRRHPTRKSMYYRCNVHETQPLRCAGFSVKVELLDYIVWTQVCEDLTTPGKFEELAERQLRQDMSDNPASRLSQQHRVRADIERKISNLQAAIADTDSSFVRATLLTQLEQLVEDKKRHDDELAALERLAGDYARRQAVLTDINRQIARHMQLILKLLRNLDDPSPADVGAMHNICQSLGVRAKVRPNTDGQLDVVVEYNLGVATGASWFPTPADDTDPQGADGQPHRSVQSPLRRA